MTARDAPSDQVPTDGAPSDDWCAHHFDHLSPVMWRHLHDTMARLRAHCPVAHSEEHGGFWVVSRYEDVLGVAQDWRTFSSAHGTGVPAGNEPPIPAIPEHVDPPLHTEYKQLLSPFFTPRAVARWEPASRRLAGHLIDGFAAEGRCELMSDFARPFPGLVFFEQVLHAPAGDIERINQMATAASMPGHPAGRQSWKGLFDWVTEFVADRRARAPVGDVVDAVLAGEVDGRPLSDKEVYGTILLLILGGLETTAGALGHFFLRFCAEPELPALLRRHPELLREAVEELLRLEGPFLAIARTATRDTEIGGQPVRRGERVLIHWASANRDEAEFPDPGRFDLARKANRHLAFGAGPHRCIGSALARMNLRVAVEELLRCLDDIRLDGSALENGAESITFHSALNRAPLSLPLTFAPAAASARAAGP